MSKWPSISAITLFVDDLDAAKSFYEQVFGLSVYFEDPQSAIFKFGDNLINLLEEPAVPEIDLTRNVGSKWGGIACSSPFQWMMSTPRAPSSSDEVL